jgi:hypothetical protein
MTAINWGLVSDGGVFESLMHAILYARDPGTILFGRKGKDAAQDARSGDGLIVYQAKYRKSLDMDGAIALALEELKTIKKYRNPAHANYQYWEHATHWVLAANLSINPNDDARWRSEVIPAFRSEGLEAEYWGVEILEGHLAQHPQVRDVFFGGENRVLVGLKEAHDLLAAECVGSVSLDVPMVGRSVELDSISSFAAANNKRVLPIIGPGGIGKSRLLYESLLSLANNGWRVLWALPGTMAGSSQWFRLLNGTQQTCVALDDPSDPHLLRAVIEQLATVERRNWRIIISCRTEKADLLRRYRTNALMAAPIKLSGLDEVASHNLVNSVLDAMASPAWLHSVFSFTQGVPGWLCLIAELTKQQKLSDLPASAEDVAAVYVDSCLDSLGDQKKEQSRVLLRWLALWGTTRIETDTEQELEEFLDQQGVSRKSWRDLLDGLVSTGLMRNWGVGKRYYAVEPLIVRQHVLSDWLLTQDNGEYATNHAGRQLVSDMLAGSIPLLDSVLQTLSQLARSRLDGGDALIFLRPVFAVLTSTASEGDLLQQHHVVDLVERMGAADPEGALDILTAIREHPKPDIEINVAPWGPQTLEHSALVGKLPWLMFQMAEEVTDVNVARCYLDAFRQLIAAEDAGTVQAGRGKGSRQLLGRLLCHDRHGEIFGPQASDIVTSELGVASNWPFVGLLCESLLNPMRESMEWVSNWTLTISRRAIAPGSTPWALAKSVRAQVIGLLQSNTDHKVRMSLWHVLSESHHAFHRAILHNDVTGNAADSYHNVLLADLQACVNILGSPPVPIGIEEATEARALWKWYLEYGQKDDLVGLARQCEGHYNGLSHWRLQDFFRFDDEQALTPETDRVVNKLREATSVDLYVEFFDEARRFLTAARHGLQDAADNWRIKAIADSLAEDCQLDQPELSPLSTFVVNVLSGNQLPENQLAWGFAVRMCQRHLFNVKSTHIDSISQHLKTWLEMTGSKDRLLWELYSNVHPLTTGPVTQAELAAVLEHQDDLNARDFFTLLGSLAVADIATVKAHLQNRLDLMREDVVEASRCVGRFITATSIATLRYKWPREQVPIQWIVEIIITYGLDGALLGHHDLEQLRDYAHYRLSMIETARLMRSRIELEGKDKPAEGFEIVPYKFNIGDWCHFDPNDPDERKAFFELCEIALSPTFTALYWMPKYMTQLDPSGEQVAAFVDSYLESHQQLEAKDLSRLGYLASAYSEESAGWVVIAGPICGRTNTMRRDDRERVYFGLARQETGVISSMPGEVPEYYLRAKEMAATLLQNEPSNSPLYGYRQWAMARAEADLQREKERAEEVANGRFTNTDR